MALNGYGQVQITDFGAPETITMLVQSGAYSGGQLIGASGTPINQLSSGIDSYASSDLYAEIGSRCNFVGIAMGTAASGTDAYLPVCTNGIFLLAAGGSCYAGKQVEQLAQNIDNGAGVAGLGSHAAANATDGVEGYAIGRALNTAASGGFVLVKIGA